MKPTPAGALVARFQLRVKSDDEIAELVKESEVRTGKPGRAFVIRSADRLAYRVLHHPDGLEIALIHGGARACAPVFVPTGTFEQHPLAHAQRAGCLFMQALS
jgi:hypothetical protein